MSNMKLLLLRSCFVGLSLLLLSPIVFAQDKIVSFPDSTQLDPTIWEGTLDRFQLTHEGLRLNDSKPQKNSNQALLGCKITNSSTLSWTGAIEFDMLPTSRNRIDIFLYPINSTRDANGVFHTRYMVLSVEKEKRAELQCVKTSQVSPSSPLVFESREVVISNTIGYDFVKGDTNKLDYLVSFDASTSQWSLFVNCYSPYTPPRLIEVGTEVYSDDYQYQTVSWIKSKICITYSKSNASAVLIKSLGFYTRLLDPESAMPKDGSIIKDVIYDGNALRLLCIAIPNVEKASFHLSPEPGELTATVEGTTITLPLVAPLSVGSYQLQVEGITFEDGTLSPPERFSFDILDEGAETKDKDHPLLSEIMPYPEVDGTEFIEFYNASKKVIDLRNYGLMLRKEGRASKIIPLEVNNYLLKPNDYIVICAWGERLAEQFPSLTVQKIAELKSFPSLPNTEGQLTLLRLEDKATLETFAYNYKSYAPKGKKRGYSLERIDYTIKASESGNWKAASEQAGYATPGKPNSIPQNDPSSVDKEKRKGISLKDIVKIILAADAIKGSKVRILFYSQKGEREAVWHHDQVLQWARSFEKGEETHFPLYGKRVPFLLYLQVREGSIGKPKGYCVPMLSLSI